MGLFVDVKRWALLYLFAGSGTFGPMPYLDMHGEVDQGARFVHCMEPVELAYLTVCTADVDILRRSTEHEWTSCGKYG